MKKNSLLLVLIMISLALSGTIILALLSIGLSNDSESSSKNYQYKKIILKEPTQETVETDDSTKSVIDDQKTLGNEDSLSKKESETKTRRSSGTTNHDDTNSQEDAIDNTVDESTEMTTASRISMLNVLRNCEKTKSELPPPTIPV